jgi:MFS family permease
MQILQRNELFKYKLFTLFYSNAVGIFYALYAARLTVEYHLSTTQLLMLNLIYVFSSIIFEIPGGIIADRIGHKKTIVSGVMCWFLSAFIFSAGKNYNLFIISEIFGALGYALMSGSTDAWLGSQFNTSDSFNSFKRKLNQTNRYITFFLMLVSGFIAKLIGYDYAYMISAGMYLVAFAISLTFGSTKLAKSQKDKINLFTSVKTYFKNPILRLTGILGFFNQAFIVSVIFLWSPLVKLDFKFDDSILGLVIGFMSVGGLIGGYLESVHSTKLNHKPYVSEFGFLVIKGAGILFVGLMSTINPYLAVAGLAFVTLINEANTQFSALHLNKYWRGQQDEATLASIHAFVCRMGNPFGCLLIGFVADHFSRTTAFYVSGIGMILSSVLIVISLVAYKKAKTLVYN